MKRTELPELFVCEMEKLLGEEMEAYLDSFDEERLYGLRTNRIKLGDRKAEDVLPFFLTPVPWTENGYYYDESLKPAKDVYYYAGLYYLQEPSAMAPAAILPVEPGDVVLDMCAAPGGKSTELGARLAGEGMLIANDISSSRAKALLKNLELFGIENICVTSEAPEKLLQAFPEFFDKILIDAPCSGEGMFRKDSSMINSWLKNGPDYYAGIQKEIVSNAVGMLKPGGLMLYSTCTFSKKEDEDIINYILENFTEMETVDIKGFEGAVRGIGVNGCIRIFPHKVKGEGHFIALLRKKDDNIRIQFPAMPVKTEKIPKELKEFLMLISREFSEERFLIKNNMVYYIPEGFNPKCSLRYLRTGLLMGELKKGRFEPCQALAMALKPEEFNNIIDFKRDDERVIRYLKGETIILNDSENTADGWCLVCVDGFSLGFAKGSKKMLKNKYYPGWRWQ